MAILAFATLGPGPNRAAWLTWGGLLIATGGTILAAFVAVSGWRTILREVLWNPPPPPHVPPESEPLETKLLGLVMGLVALGIGSGLLLKGRTQTDYSVRLLAVGILLVVVSGFALLKSPARTDGTVRRVKGEPRGTDARGIRRRGRWIAGGCALVMSLVTLYLGIDREWIHPDPPRGGVGLLLVGAVLFVAGVVTLVDARTPRRE